MVVATGGPPVAPGGSDRRAARRHDPAPTALNEQPGHLPDDGPVDDVGRRARVNDTNVPGTALRLGQEAPADAVQVLGASALDAVGRAAPAGRRLLGGQ